LSTQPVEAVADFPRKLRCLFDPARYKILYGGRGGAKSWGIARALLILGARNKLRIACGREVQKSIAQSVHHLLKTQIEALGLQAAYRIFDSQIVGTNGTLITFHGLKTNIDSVKSLEGIDIFWVEEAQTVSKTSWDVLIPTIRKDGSEIWVSFNPELDTDETYVRFVLSPPAGAIVVKINWRDNPWFNAVLQAELEATRARSEDDYLHTWEGNTRQVLDGAIYANEIRAAVADNRFTRVPYDEAKPVETFWDLGRADNTSIWFAQCVGFEFRVIDFYESNGHHLTHYLKVLRERPYLYGDLWLPHDAQAKTVGMERTIEQQARDAGFSVRIAPKSENRGRDQRGADDLRPLLVRPGEVRGRAQPPPAISLRGRPGHAPVEPQPAPRRAQPRGRRLPLPGDVAQVSGQVAADQLRARAGAGMRGRA
jgi:phage terminase large subunit